MPITLVQHIHKTSSSSANHITVATADLINIDFYFLLRVGEYTKPRKVKVNGAWKPATRTRQFRVGDLGFFKDNKVLPRNSPLSILLTADSATLKISNQKNGRMGQTIHQESTGDSGAVASLARRVNHILSSGGSDKNLICDVHHLQTWTSVTNRGIISYVRKGAVELDLAKQGIDPDLIGSHSLRAGGAMALKLHDYPDTTIQKLGRWSSATWLDYIHNQIAHISHGVAKSMSEQLPFVNIGFIEPPSTS